MRVFTFWGGDGKSGLRPSVRAGRTPPNANVQDEGPMLEIGLKFLDKAGTRNNSIPKLRRPPA